ncbi:outer membrane protein [Methylocystis heyeri]|uniref:Outer membrane beta-barrel protein n=1 Tax=Methylocystis heyeri TaxID=391905 RepID=A0A6B8KBK9_9HYPH|nr:outer membrane beta-barrel protein [Methylocystis heyeri]QGM45794.1 outer membrane beta-barrel protein [Methylocystis heyeri]
MKKTLLGATVVALALAAAPALAADLPLRKEAPAYAPPPPVLTWNGFYAGVNIGGGWSANNNNNNWGWANNNTASGVVGGGQVGYNFQWNSFLLGVETDFQGTSISRDNNNAALFLFGSASPFGSPFIPGASFGAGAGFLPSSESLPWFGTVRGRLGYLVTPTLLIYGTGGFAYGEVNAGWISNTRTGWSAGGGVEWMFMPNWSAKIEYLYTDLSSGGTTGGWGWNYGYHIHPQFNTVRLGVNWHFNFGGNQPVLAKF